MQIASARDRSRVVPDHGSACFGSSHRGDSWDAHCQGGDRTPGAERRQAGAARPDMVAAAIVASAQPLERSGSRMRAPCGHERTLREPARTGYREGRPRAAGCAGRWCSVTTSLALPGRHPTVRRQLWRRMTGRRVRATGKRPEADLLIAAHDARPAESAHMGSAAAARCSRLPDGPGMKGDPDFRNR